MKRILCALLCLTLLLAAASAEGLGGLSGGLGGLSGALPAASTALPDPAGVLGAPGTLLQANYQFSLDYLCNAYVYSTPADLDGFVTQYTALAGQNGFAVQSTTVDGLTAYRLENESGLYALLVPEFQGNVLLLVDVNLEFEGSQSAGAAPASPEADYIRFDYNGREVYLDGSVEGDVDSSGFELRFWGERMIFKYVVLNFPGYAQEGDVFHDTKNDKVENMTLYMDGSTSYVPSHNFWVDDYPGGYDGISGENDFFTLTVETMKEDESGIELVITFEGTFNKGTEKLENGRLHVHIVK